MKTKRTIQGKEFLLVAVERSDVVDMSFDPADDTLRPMTMVIHTLWQLDAKGLLAAVRSGASIPFDGTAGFAVEGDEVLARFMGDSVRVPRVMFEECVAVYDEVINNP